MTAPSPFLPNSKLQYAWDSTSLGWLKTCPRYYQLSMIEGWRSKRPSVHLIFGGHYASAIERYHKARAQNQDHTSAIRSTLRQLLIDTFGWQSDDPNKNRETLIRSVLWYLDKWSDDPAKTVILSNNKPAVELSFRLELDETNILCGHLDRVVEFGGEQFVMDQKTSKNTLTGYYFAQYEPNNQMSLYTIAAKIVFNAAVKGVIIDAAQVAVGFTEFSRGMTYRTEEQLQEWLADVKYWIRTAKVYAEANYWPMNDTACSNYGGCTFRGICSKSPQVRQNFLATDFEVRPWNPLEPR